ncbi:MAG: STAS domain-containing protein [Leptospira sp.]|nr:STAS domain-containing protein [Leptospira sp.]
MEIKLRKTGNTSIIDLSGSLDIYTATDFKTFIESNVSAENNSVVVNLEKLNYIDSSGIGMLIKQLNFVQNLKGQLKIANMKPPIEKVFKVAGLTTYFQTISEDEFNKNYK